MPDPEEGRRRKQRNLAIAGLIAAFVIIVYFVTILKIGGQIVERLQPDGKPQHAVADTQLGACLRPDLVMRGRRRVRDQALGIPKVIRKFHDAKRIEETER